MSIRAQMATSTAGIKGVTGERPSGSGVPGPKAGYNIDNQKASRLSMIGHQSLDATRPDRQKHTNAPQPQTNKIDQTWKGDPHSVNHVNA